jgi:hypothetical protein
MDMRADATAGLIAVTAAVIGYVGFNAWNDAGDLEYPPAFSLLPLPGFTAETL